MGATMPAMDQIVVSIRERGRWIGAIYAANTLGAVGDYVGNAGNNSRGGLTYWRPGENGTLITAPVESVAGLGARLQLARTACKA